MSHFFLLASSVCHYKLFLIGGTYYFFLLIDTGDVIPPFLFFLKNKSVTFEFTKLIRMGIDNIYVTEKQKHYDYYTKKPTCLCEYYCTAV